jgi:uncharacterized protein
VYQFRWVVNPEQSVLRIDYRDALHHPGAAKEITLSTSISGEHRDISVVSCMRALFAYPVQAVTVVARIHWQAIKLWVKRVPFYSKPIAPEQGVSLSTGLALERIKNRIQTK